MAPHEAGDRASDLQRSMQVETDGYRLQWTYLRSVLHCGFVGHSA